MGMRCGFLTFCMRIVLVFQMTHWWLPQSIIDQVRMRTYFGREGVRR